jgi:integrase
VGRNPDGKPAYREVRGRTEAQARAKKKALEERARDGFGGDANRVCVGAYLADWIRAVRPSVQPSTWASYERCVRLHLLPRKIAGVLLSELRVAHVRGLYAELAGDGVSGGNAKKISEVLNAALEDAVEGETIPRNPSAPAAKPKAGEPEIDPFTPAEVALIRKAADGNRMGAMITLAIASGMREGELLGLGWECVDLGRGVVHVRQSLDQGRGGFSLKGPKSRHGLREIDLPPFAVNALARHREAVLKEGNIGAPVFCTKTGKHVGKSNFVRQVWGPLLKRAGVRYRKFHTCRHTHASELLSRGVGVAEVARRLGDKQETVIRAYSHFIPSGVQGVAERVQAMYEGVPEAGHSMATLSG